MKKLAMIGCGGIGGYHLSHFLNFQDIELAGFCDLIPERAESFVSKAGGGKAFTNYKEMYDAINPDMVFICIPPTEHGEIEFETINRRIPFFVEKPVALCMDLARQIRDEVKKAGLITAAGFQCRYSNLVGPNVKFIKENEIIFVDCIRIGGVPGVPWWRKRSTSGGQIVEQTIHQFDIIRYVFDEPDMVFTMGTKGFVTDFEDYDTEDLSTTVVRFKSGALAAISTGCYATGGNAADSKIVFSSRDARAELRILSDLKIFGYKDNNDIGNNGADADSKSDKSKGFVIKGDGALSVSKAGEITYKQEGSAGILCDRTFIDAVLTGDSSKIRSPYEDAVRTLEFTLACNRSMDTGLPIKIQG
ncbi:MAG TPA: Gfo/Idh/MocA family oxidoreductase [Clostridiales bacterium]|nr:Gfo/Idh/MocA family oxidoreductase [Clostridiales bacterium]